MGAKSAILALCPSSTTVPAALRELAADPSRSLDARSCAELLAVLKPGTTYAHAADESACLFDDTIPRGDEVYVLRTREGVDLLVDSSVMLDLPSGHFDSHAADWAKKESKTLIVHAMHSVVDFFAFAVFAGDGELIRALSVSIDDGVMEEEGARLAVEQPFWEGEHPLFDRDEDRGSDDGEDTLPFHPLALGEAVLKELIGFIIEGHAGQDTSDCVDAESIMMHVFRPVDKEETGEGIEAGRTLPRKSVQPTPSPISSVSAICSLEPTSISHLAMRAFSEYLGWTENAADALASTAWMALELLLQDRMRMEDFEKLAFTLKYTLGTKNLTLSHWNELLETTQRKSSISTDITETIPILLELPHTGLTAPAQLLAEGLLDLHAALASVPYQPATRIKKELWQMEYSFYNGRQDMVARHFLMGLVERMTVERSIVALQIAIYALAARSYLSFSASLGEYTGDATTLELFRVHWDASEWARVRDDSLLLRREFVPMFEWRELSFVASDWGDPRPLLRPTKAKRRSVYDQALIKEGAAFAPHVLPIIFSSNQARDFEAISFKSVLSGDGLFAAIWRDLSNAKGPSLTWHGLTGLALHPSSMMTHQTPRAATDSPPSHVATLALLLLAMTREPFKLFHAPERPLDRNEAMAVLEDVAKSYVLEKEETDMDRAAAVMGALVPLAVATWWAVEVTPTRRFEETHLEAFKKHWPRVWPRKVDELDLLLPPRQEAVTQQLGDASETASRRVVPYTRR